MSDGRLDVLQTVRLKGRTTSEDVAAVAGITAGRDKLDALTTTVPLDDAIAAATRILDGSVRGRIVVKIG